MKHNEMVGYCDAFLLLVSITTYLLDIVTDILVGLLYLYAGDYFWGGLTLGLVAVPSVAIQVFSGRWYLSDGETTHPVCCWLLHFLQLQPLERYTMTLVAGLEAHRIKSQASVEYFYIKQNDVSMLRLIQAYLQSAPQLTVQLYILAATENSNALTLSSALVSLLCLGWAVATYSHTLRQAYQQHYSKHGAALVTQTVCHTLIAAARVCSIVAFAASFQHWVFVVLGTHWLVMTIWIILQNTDFCENQVEEKLFDCIVGIIYCFNFFNLKEGHTRWRALGFYSIAFAENTTAITLWYVYKPERSWFDPLICVIVALLFFAGLSFMMLYYLFCHPSHPFTCARKQQQQQTPIFRPGRTVLSNSIYSSSGASNSSKTSTPMLRKHVSNKAVRAKHASSVPQYSSIVQLPRHLKPQPSAASIHYKAVASPGPHLSPIKSARPSSHSGLAYRNKYSYQDSSFDWLGASGFQHYSIDATAAIQSFDSRVSGLQANRLNLSSENVEEVPPPSIGRQHDDDMTDREVAGISARYSNQFYPYEAVDLGTFGSPHRKSPGTSVHSKSPYHPHKIHRDSYQSVSASPARFSYPVVRSTYNNSNDVHNYSTAIAKHYAPPIEISNTEPKAPSSCVEGNSGPIMCVMEGCQHCGKSFPYMDDSVENLVDAATTEKTIDFCNCTLMGILGSSPTKLTETADHIGSNVIGSRRFPLEFPSHLKNMGQLSSEADDPYYMGPLLPTTFTGPIRNVNDDKLLHAVEK